MTQASVLGGSGYTGGELLRLIEGHPELELGQATSRSKERRTVANTHPNLRGATDQRFVHPDDLEETDLLFTATPHGYTKDEMPELRDLAEVVVDLSGDYRLSDADAAEGWYGEHPNTDLLEEFVYGVPELHRAEMEDANLIASAGCNATAGILALHPLVEHDLIDERVVLDVKTSSSAGGAGASTASHHSERSRVVRPYAPTEHRHQAEIQQETGLDVDITVHAIEMVRGLAVTAHTYAKDDVEDKDLYQAYRGVYGDEEFVRVVKSRRGNYRYPEPKVTEGTNYADVGFALDDEGDGATRVVSFAALDNMMKGAAGQAVQCANLAMGFDEQAGLEFQGMHPV